MQTFSRLLEPQTFINFRGIDTRLGFTGFLNKYLTDRGFCTFFDDDSSIERGARIPDELINGIKESSIFIAVLSENYATSDACLDELANTLEEFKKMNYGRWIFPVFYYVKISDVKNQTGSYGKALAVLKNTVGVTPERYQKWTNALTEVAGFHCCLMEQGSGIDEWKYITEIIIPEVSRHVACSIGLDRRIEKALSCLNSGPDDDRVCIAAICGVPGIGKTTQARGVYYFRSDIEFDYRCFLDNVDAYFKKHGSEFLIQMLLSKIVGEKTMSESVDEEGMSRMKHMLKIKKVFLILEDIHDSKVLEDIVELTTLFGSGSIVIITTTREKCFLETHGIKFERIYEVERMIEVEAFQLLNLKAFDSINVSLYYTTILEHAKTYAAGHPFNLELIGSYLSGKSVEECESALKQYEEKIPNRETKKILQVSFDALDIFQQNMLIHIALRLRGHKLAVVEYLLHCEFEVCPKNDIRVLLRRSLIKINENGQVILHGLTLDMVRDKVHVPFEDLD